MTDPLSRRELNRKRSHRRRRLIAAVVIIDVLGGAALAVALTRHHSSPKVAVVSFPASTAQPAATTISAPVTHDKPVATHHASHPGHKQTRPRRGEHPAAAQGPAAQPSDAQASYARFSATLPGSVGLAIAPLAGGPVSTFGELQVGHAWSTMKVPVLATVLAGASGVFGQQALAARALEASDNAAAEALFADLERDDGGLVGASESVQETLRRSGDDATAINTAPNNEGFTTWGQSEWSASDEVIFYRALARGCLLDSSQTQYVLSLMREVESDQRWGAGSAGLPSQLPLGFKGGWGPEADGRYLVRQTAIAGTGDQGYVFSMLAKPADGQFSTGTELVTDVARWVRRTFPLTATHPTAGC